MWIRALIVRNLLTGIKIFCTFTVADRLAEAPVWGLAERDVVKIHKKAFIRADSCPLGILAKFILVTRIE